MSNDIKISIEEVLELVNFTRDSKGRLRIGDVYGYVGGTVHDSVDGDVLGNVVGNVRGAVIGDVMGSVHGNVKGSVIGFVYGTVAGKSQ